MAGFRKYDEHEQLVGRMTDALGVDLDEKMQSGEVTPDDLQETVYRCMSCEDPEACKSWLEAHDGQRAETTPPYCRNQEQLQDLRRG